jgi:nitroreductase
MTDSTDIFDIIHTTRAMRRLKPDPVPDELIRKILEAGICAANGSNRQTWRFLVVKDRTIKERVQHFYKRAFDEWVSPRYQNSAPPPGSTADKYSRQHTAVEYLTDHFHEAPVWIVACLDEGDSTPSRSSGASIYPSSSAQATTCRRSPARTATSASTTCSGTRSAATTKGASRPGRR